MCVSVCSGKTSREEIPEGGGGIECPRGRGLGNRSSFPKENFRNGTPWCVYTEILTTVDFPLHCSSLSLPPSPSSSFYLPFLRPLPLIPLFPLSSLSLLPFLHPSLFLSLSSPPLSPRSPSSVLFASSPPSFSPPSLPLTLLCVLKKGGAKLLS